MAGSGSYLPLFRPGDTVTFAVTAAVTGGTPVEQSLTADRAVGPASAGSARVVGVAGHSAAPGDKLTVEIGKPIHSLTASGAVTRGQRLEAAGGGRVRTLAAGSAVYLALTSAADGASVEALQL
jgi:hypothetical protein